ncbi:hypothetical protein IT575_13850 [bacterium]|nr:hypothetical protein [bacterium]
MQPSKDSFAAPESRPELDCGVLGSTGPPEAGGQDPAPGASPLEESWGHAPLQKLREAPHLRLIHIDG